MNKANNEDIFGLDVGECDTPRTWKTSSRADMVGMYNRAGVFESCVWIIAHVNHTKPIV